MRESSIPLASYSHPVFVKFLISTDFKLACTKPVSKKRARSSVTQSTDAVVMDVSEDLMGLIWLSRFTAGVRSSALLFRQRTKMAKVVTVNRQDDPCKEHISFAALRI